VRVRAVNGAGAGPASTEIALTVGAGGIVAPDPPANLFAMMSGSRLVLSWDGAFGGGAPVDYLVEAGTATGLANIATIPVNRLAFTYDPVPNGFYFLRVRARNAAGVSDSSNEVMIAMGNGPSPPGQPLQFGGAATGSTVSLTWVGPAGAVTGYVIEAGSAPGLSNLATVSIGALTSVSFPGVPAGRYYVRIRAVNGLGRSVASDDIVVVVGSS
jgi:hypothetical protein